MENGLGDPDRSMPPCAPAKRAMSSGFPFRNGGPADIEPTVEQRVLAFAKAREGRSFTVPEVCAELLLAPDVAYRAITFLVKAGDLVPVEASRERELELAATI